MPRRSLFLTLSLLLLCLPALAADSLPVEATGSLSGTELAALGMVSALSPGLALLVIAWKSGFPYFAPLVYGGYAAVDLILDKFPVADHINHFVEYLAIWTACYLAAENLGADANLLLPVLAGTGTQAGRQGLRYLVSTGSGGVLNPVKSTAEDVISLIGLAILVLWPG